MVQKFEYQRNMIFSGVRIETSKKISSEFTPAFERRY